MQNTVIKYFRFDTVTDVNGEVYCAPTNFRSDSRYYLGYDLSDFTIKYNIKRDVDFEPDTFTITVDSYFFLNPTADPKLWDNKLTDVKNSFEPTTNHVIVIGPIPTNKNLQDAALNGGSYGDIDTYCFEDSYPSVSSPVFGLIKSFVKTNAGKTEIVCESFLKTLNDFQLTTDFKLNNHSGGNNELQIYYEYKYNKSESSAPYFAGKSKIPANSNGGYGIVQPTNTTQPFIIPPYPRFVFTATEVHEGYEASKIVWRLLQEVGWCRDQYKTDILSNLGASLVSTINNNDTGFINPYQDFKLADSKKFNVRTMYGEYTNFKFTSFDTDGLRYDYIVGDVSENVPMLYQTYYKSYDPSRQSILYNIKNIADADSLFLTVTCCPRYIKTSATENVVDLVWDFKNVYGDITNLKRWGITAGFRPKLLLRKNLAPIEFTQDEVTATVSSPVKVDIPGVPFDHIHYFVTFNNTGDYKKFWSYKFDKGMKGRIRIRWGVYSQGYYSNVQMKINGANIGPNMSTYVYGDPASYDEYIDISVSDGDELEFWGVTTNGYTQVFGEFMINYDVIKTREVLTGSFVLKSGTITYGVWNSDATAWNSANVLAKAIRWEKDQTDVINKVAVKYGQGTNELSKYVEFPQENVTDRYFYMDIVGTVQYASSILDLTIRVSSTKVYKINKTYPVGALDYQIARDIESTYDRFNTDYSIKATGGVIVITGKTEDVKNYWIDNEDAVGITLTKTSQTTGIISNKTTYIGSTFSNQAVIDLSCKVNFIGHEPSEFKIARDSQKRNGIRTTKISLPEVDSYGDVIDISSKIFKKLANEKFRCVTECNDLRGSQLPIFTLFNVKDHSNTKQVLNDEGAYIKFKVDGTATESGKIICMLPFPNSKIHFGFYANVSNHDAASTILTNLLASFNAVGIVNIITGTIMADNIIKFTYQVQEQYADKTIFNIANISIKDHGLSTHRYVNPPGLFKQSTYDELLMLLNYQADSARGTHTCTFGLPQESLANIINQSINWISDVEKGQ